jgi:quercetin dioxygenase-like cupin family protein
MKTRDFTPAEMNERISRFDKLTPIPAQSNPKIPLPAADLIFSRKLLPVISHPDVKGPFGNLSPIKGAAGMTMTMAVCPPGTGPGLHTHHQTYETFTVLQGSFRFIWGDTGDRAEVLNRFDTISIPPGICRGFTNVSQEDGILQVLITGGIHDMNDIAFPPTVAEAIDKIGPGIRAEFEKIGLRFNAGAE